jgi:hypothetical protein
MVDFDPNNIFPPTKGQDIVFGQNKYNGVLLSKTPPSVYKEIDLLVQNLIDNDFKAVEYNDRLAGHINKEYELKPTPLIKEYIKSLVQAHSKEFYYYNILLSRFLSPPTLSIDNKLWVNLQSKYEYNPPHIHGGIFSFVFWHKVPYYIKPEQEYGPGKNIDNRRNKNGKFSFILPDNQFHAHLAEIPIPVDKTWEGVIAFFPASMHHAVYPFYTSDEYRITVAGNVYFK